MSEKPNARAFDDQFFPDGGQLMGTILARDSEFWGAYSIQNKERALGTGNSGGFDTKTITGKSESGAIIKIRDHNNAVYHDSSAQSFDYSSNPKASEEELSQYKKGISVMVTPPHDPNASSTTVELFVPDDPEQYPGLQPPHAVTFSETGGAPLLEAELNGDKEMFDKGIEQIKFYLGDKVIWDSPQDKDIPPPPNDDPFEVV